MHELFGTKHIILIIISVILIVGFYFLFRKLRFSTLCKVLLILAGISEVVKVFTYTIMNEAKLGGILPKTDLPLHLCSIQIVFLLIITFTNSDKIKRVLLSFMLPSCLFGGIAAILIATGSSLNNWVITVQYFSYHAMLSAFAIYLFSNKVYKWNIKDYVSSLIFVVGMMFVAIYINSILYDGVNRVNFMYVVEPPQKNLPYLNNNNGWLSYISRYALLVFGCITTCYIKPIVVAIKSKFSKKNGSEEIEKDTNKNTEEK